MTLKITAKIDKKFKEVINDECLNFIEELNKNFNFKRLKLLNNRKIIQEKIDNGWTPDFLTETSKIRNSDWKILSSPDKIFSFGPLFFTELTSN